MVDGPRWTMKKPGEPVGPADPSRQEPGPEEVLVEIDACSLWRRNVGFAFGEQRGGGAPALAPRISGHVVEAGDGALYFTDRAVDLSAIAPCGQHEACWTGTVTECPHRTAAAAGREGAVARSVIAPVAAVEDAGKHQPHPLGPGFPAFKDG